jgi:hypothetical protein
MVFWRMSGLWSSYEQMKAVIGNVCTIKGRYAVLGLPLPRLRGQSFGLPAMEFVSLEIVRFSFVP